jgi:signal transduction histidine kinase
VLPKPRFFSASYRLAAVYAGLLFLSFAVAAIATSIATRSAALEDARTRIVIEANAILHEAETEGVPAAIAAVSARARQPGALEYRVIDGAGRTVAGKEGLPFSDLGWRTVNGDGGDYLLYAAALPTGGGLVVADDLERVERVRDQIIRTLLLIAAVTAAIGLIASFWITRRMLARIDTLSATAQRISAGDLNARAPVRGNDGDDIDSFTQTFNAMLDRISALISSMRRVSTDIAHDLRTPLTHVGQALERAGRAESLETARAEIEGAQRGVDQVTRTFAAMLRLAEIEAGELRQRFSQVDLGALVERVVDAYRPDIEAGGRKVTVSSEGATVVAGDGDLLAQALANLIENVMRHTPPGAALHVRVSASENGAHLVVEDNGLGVPIEARAKVLEPFVRLDAARAQAGAGLGLSIVAAIAKLHHATLKIEDAAPGLRVRIVFPDDLPSGAGH